MAATVTAVHDEIMLAAKARLGAKLHLPLYGTVWDVGFV